MNRRNVTKLLGHSAMILISRLLLGGIFLYAGIIKVADPPGFALAIRNYQLVPDGMVNVIAMLLPWIEIVIGAGLILGAGTHGAALVSAFLLGAFALALAINLARGLDISCGCFSTAPSTGSINWLYLIRDLSLLAMALHIYRFDRGMLAITGLASRGKTATD